MLIITVEIMKTIDKIERCDTRCEIWKKNAKNNKKTNKDRKHHLGGTNAIVKEWEINNFAVHLSFLRFSQVNMKSFFNF